MCIRDRGEPNTIDIILSPISLVNKLFRAGRISGHTEICCSRNRRPKENTFVFSRVTAAHADSDEHGPDVADTYKNLAGLCGREGNQVQAKPGTLRTRETVTRDTERVENGNDTRTGNPRIRRCD